MRVEWRRVGPDAPTSALSTVTTTAGSRYSGSIRHLPPEYCGIAREVWWSPRPPRLAATIWVVWRSLGFIGSFADLRHAGTASPSNVTEGHVEIVGWRGGRSQVRVSP